MSMFPMRNWWRRWLSSRRSLVRRPRGTACRPRLEDLESRLVLSTDTFSNTQGGDWDVGANWSTGMVPGPNDDVLINLPGITVTHNANTTEAVKSLRVTTSNPLNPNVFVFNLGQLTTATGSSGLLVDTNSTLTVNGGVVGMELNNETGFDVTTGATLNYNGGTLKSPVTLHLANLNISPNATNAASFIAQNTVTFGGTIGANHSITVQGNSSLTSQLLIPAGATNNGTIVLDNISNYYSAANLNIQGGILTNSATGTIKSVYDAGSSRTVYGYLKNQGAILADSNAPLHLKNGTYEAAGGTMTNTTYVDNENLKVTASPAAGTTIPLWGSCTLLDNGLASTVLPKTTVWVRGDSSLTTTLNVAGGMSNAGTILLDNPANYYTYAVLQVTSGVFTNAGGGVIQGRKDLGGSRTINGYVKNQGTIDVASDAETHLYGTYEANGGTITNPTNPGFFVTNSNVKVTASPTDGTSTTIPLWGSCTLLDNGQANTVLAKTVLWVRGGSSLTTTLNVAGGMSNAGTILLQNAANYYTNAVLQVAGGVFTNAAGGTVRGVLSFGGSRSINGYLQNQGLIDVDTNAPTYLYGTYEANGGTINNYSFYVTNSNVKVTASPSNGGQTTIVLRGGCTLLDNGQANTILPKTTLWVQGDSSLTTTLNVTDGMSNAGTILLQNVSSYYSGAHLAVGNNGTLTNPGSIQVTQTVGGGYAFNGQLDNQGLLSVSGNPTFSFNGPAVTNEATGEISGSGTLDFTNAGYFVNDGKVTVPLSNTLYIHNGFSNFLNKTLTGGTYAVTGTLKFDGADVQTNAADITLTGQTAAIVNQSNANALASFTTNQGRFSIQDGKALSIATFTNGTPDHPGELDIGKGSTFTASTSLTNFDASSGTLTGGTFVLVSDDALVPATLKFNNADVQTNAATVVLDGPGAKVVDTTGNSNDGLRDFGVNNGQFTVQNGRNFTRAGDFTDQGTVSVGSNSTFLATGNYTEGGQANVSGGGTLQIGAAGSFTNSGIATVLAGGTLQVDGTFTNYDATSGTLSGGTFWVGGTLKFAGTTITTNAANLILDGPTATVLGSNGDALAHLAVNTGSFTTQDGSNLTLSAAFSNQGYQSVGAGSTFTINGGAYDQSGTLSVQAGGTLKANYALANFDSTTKTLGGGTYIIAGTFQFAEVGGIATNAATVVLDGLGDITSLTNVSALPSLTAVAAGGSLTFRNSRMLTTTGALNNAGTVTVESGAGLTTGGAFGNAGTVMVGVAASLTVTAGDYVQTAGTTILAGGTLTAGTLMNNVGSSLSGTGTIAANLVNAGQVSVGGLGGRVELLTVTGNFTQTSDGTLALTLGGLQAGANFGQLNIKGSATLDGTLTVTLAPGYFPNLNDSFRILTFASVSGNFATMNLPDLGVVLYLNPVFDATGLTLVTSAHG